MITTRIPRTKRTASNNLSPSSCLNVLRFMFRELLQSQGYSWGKMGQGPGTYALTNVKSTRPFVRLGVRLSRRSTVAAIEHGGREGKFDRAAACGQAVRGFSEMSGTLDVGAASLIRPVAVGSSSLPDEASVAAASSVSDGESTPGRGQFPRRACRMYPLEAGPLEVTLPDFLHGSPVRMGSHRKIARCSGNIPRFQGVSV